MQKKNDSDYFTYAASYYLNADDVTCCYDEEQVKEAFKKVPWSWYIDLESGVIEQPKETTVGIEYFTSSSDASIVNMLDEAGYQQNTRYSRWSNGDIIAAGWDTTGYIAARPGDVIQLKNVDWKHSTENEAHGSIYWYDGERNILDKVETAQMENLNDWEVGYDDNGNIIQFRIPKFINGSASYIRMTCQDITDASVITVDPDA